MRIRRSKYGEAEVAQCPVQQERSAAGRYIWPRCVRCSAMQGGWRRRGGRRLLRLMSAESEKRGGVGCALHWTQGYGIQSITNMELLREWEWNLCGSAAPADCWPAEVATTYIPLSQAAGSWNAGIPGFLAAVRYCGSSLLHFPLEETERRKHPSNPSYNITSKVKSSLEKSSWWWFVSNFLLAETTAAKLSTFSL